MIITREDIDQGDKIWRINIINSITGIKPGNLIGTKSDAGISNLAIISSVVHLGSNPPLIGFIMRPNHEVKRDTYKNIMENGYFTINHVNNRIIKQAHYTSAKFDEDISEFDTCELTEEYLNDFSAPFVKESKIKIGLKLTDTIDIKVNKTKLIIGEVVLIDIDKSFVSQEGGINLEKVSSIGISGLDSYYDLQFIDQFPYARVEETPNFGS